MRTKRTKEIGFDDWLRDEYDWPDDVPTDCTRLDKQEQDCLQRNKPLCASCREYSKACKQYETYSREENIRARIAAGVQNKARAIADGDYDKDVDYDVRDRVRWAARLYAIADKIAAGKKLSRGEHDEMTDCENYLPMDTRTVFFIRDNV